MPSIRCGTGHVRIDVCASVWKSENAWGQGGLSEHEMDRGEGLKWLTEPVYISNSTLLCEGGRGGKTALQAEQSGIHFSVSSVFQRMLYVPYFLTFLTLNDSISLWVHVLATKAVPESSVERLVLLLLLSIMSFIPWQGAHEESVKIVALTHSGTTREERLKPSGCGGVGWIGGGVSASAREVWDTMQQEYFLSCEPLSSSRSHSTSPPHRKSSPLFIPAVWWSGGEPHQKVLDLGIDGEGVNSWGGGEERIGVCMWCLRGRGEKGAAGI